MKRGGRSRKATHRFGIDDVPLMCTPSPVRSSNVKSSASKGGSGIRRNLFTPEGGADENKARRASLRRTKLQDSDEDDPELDEDFHIRRKRTTRKKPKKRVLTMMEVDEPVETIVDGFGDASKEDEEQKSQGILPSSIGP
ncbi:Hypothetical protein FKW44_010842 [Caligus rogercresseyi]|uniref:Uncharacterized protein n=1 Tax=Caligus rogercresseyi TaxID=217165 RepID=A0A7T8HI67_CALRO|nr:Hypothetical protein FKW44_010842 [Caligus rogercresseyi]